MPIELQGTWQKNKNKNETIIKKKFPLSSINLANYL